MLVRETTLNDVHRIKRPGIGYVYRGKITIGGLYLGLKYGDIRYAPKYQRGYRPAVKDVTEYETLVEITTEGLLIEVPRAESMAAKYLMALRNYGDKHLYNPDVIWNARKDTNRPGTTYDADRRQLKLYTNLTIPDSGHRHFAYYLLGEWKNDPEAIPDIVEIEKDGDTVDGGQLAEWIEAFDPFDEEESSVLVEVFNLDKEQEGRLFDEYNDEAKKPSTAVAIDLYPDKTPSRRFIYKLMDASTIFSRGEIETRANTIGSKSRKLTTVATMEAAIRPYSKELLALEKESSKAYGDLVEFFAEFYAEWSKHYPEFQASASGEARNKLRKTSFALSNIIFFPMFRLAFELWKQYRANGADWKSPTAEWRDGVTRLGGKVKMSIPDPKDEKKTVEVAVPIMGRDSEDPPQVGNPAWQGRILVRKFDDNGHPTGWSLSSTRQTRDAAYHYLVEAGGFKMPVKVSKKAQAAPATA